MTARDLFISHSSGDAEVARALRSVLEEAGYTCWMAPDDIVGTGAWTEQILAAIADSKAMVILVSTAANASPHVSREVNLALGKGRPVLPIRIEDVVPGGSLEYLLSLVQRVDAFPPPVTLHRDRILRRLDTVVARPTPTPSASAGTGAAAAPAATEPGIGPGATTAPAQPPPPSPVTVDTQRAVAAPAPAEMSGVAVPRPTPTRKPPFPLILGGIAAAAAVALAVGVTAGLFKGPAPSPGPTGVATATAGATVAPTAAESTPAVFTPEQQALLDRLPALAGLDACSVWPTPPGGEDVLSPSGYAGSIARFTCPGPSTGGPAIRYAMYPDTESLDADFDTIMTSLGVAEGGACVTAIPANAPWSFPDTPDSGDLACFERLGRVQYVWTQLQLRVLVQWLAPDNAAGFAFWRTWTSTLNDAESDLLAALPATVQDAGACQRAPDLYYPAAVAILACPPTTGTNQVYYAQYLDAGAFPKDPMTMEFDAILTGGGFAVDTAQGCYDKPPAFGRYTWFYTGGSATNPEGMLGCYERTENDPVTAQFVWTYNKAALMGLWNAPDLTTGIAFVDAWIGEIPGR